MADQVRNACEVCFDAHKADCSGFVHAVANRLGVTLAGNADAIVDAIRNGNGWRLVEDGEEAEQAAAAGQLCVAGLKGSELASPQQHGHVAIVVAGGLARGKYPHAYWGQLHGIGKKDETINYAWREGDRDHVSYAAHEVVATSSIPIG